MMNNRIVNDWEPLLESEFNAPYYQTLNQFLTEEYQTQTIYPNETDLFNAFNYTPYSEVKVVILGQDPYHGPNQAHGLSFSVQPDVAIPPSLRNMYKELHADLGCPIPSHGSLVKWAKQGVLLLNNVLTVRQGQAHAHKGMGWERFTDHVITLLNDKQSAVIYFLWGAAAQKKARLIDTNKHIIIQSPHPSPLSAYRGFFGSKPFSKANRYLEEAGRTPIDWAIEEINHKC